MGLELCIYIHLFMNIRQSREHMCSMSDSMSMRGDAVFSTSGYYYVQLNFGHRTAYQIYGVGNEKRTK